MAARLEFPTAAEIDAGTSPDRDRAIDVIRIAALVGVVVGHTVMATSIISDAVFHWGNLDLGLPDHAALSSSPEWPHRSRRIVQAAGTTATGESA